MKALLKKDLYVLTKQSKIFLLFILVFCVMPQMTMVIFAIVYGALLPVTAFGYDERAKWSTLARMMPYSERDLVLSKYTLGYIGIFGALVLVVIVRLVIGFFFSPALTADDYAMLLVMAIFTTIIQAFTLPIMIKFGTEKGRIIFFIIFGVVAGVGSLFMSRSDGIQIFIDISMTTVAIAALAAAVIINLISIKISESIVRNKAAKA